MNDLYRLISNIQQLDRYYNKVYIESKKTLLIDKRRVGEEELDSLNKNNDSNVSELESIIAAIQRRREEENNSTYYW